MLNDLLLYRKTSGVLLGKPLIGWNYDADISTGSMDLVRSGTAPTLVAPVAPLQAYSRILRGEDNLTIAKSATISLFDVTIDALVSLGTSVTGGYFYFLGLTPFSNARF